MLGPDGIYYIRCSSSLSVPGFSPMCMSVFAEALIFFMYALLFIPLHVSARALSNYADRT